MIKRVRSASYASGVRCYSVAMRWLPTWLGARVVEGAIKLLIAMRLSAFDRNRGRIFVLQYSARARRIIKLSMALLSILTQLGQR